MTTLPWRASVLSDVKLEILFCVELDSEALFRVHCMELCRGWNVLGAYFVGLGFR